MRRYNRYQLPCKYLINGFPLNFSHPYINGVNFTPYFSHWFTGSWPTFQERGLEKPVGYNMPDVYDDEDGKGGGRTPGDAGWDGGVLVPIGGC